MIVKAILASAFAGAGIYGIGTGVRDFRQGRVWLGAIEVAVGWGLILVGVVLMFVEE